MSRAADTLNSDAGADQALAREARAFVNSTLPMVLMRMKGCEEVCANVAHDSLFHDGLAIARTVPEFVTFYEAERIGPRSVQDRGCYCEKMGALIAMRSEHCAFEWSFEKLLRTPGETSRLDFLQYETNSHRFYNVVNTHSRLLSYSLTDGSGFMLSTLVRAVSMRVQLQSDSEFRPNKIKFALEAIGKQITEPEYVSVPSDDVYFHMDERMGETMQRVGDGQSPETVRNWMLESASAIKGMDYGAVGAFIAGLFRATDQDQILARLRHERARLFDAPTIFETSKISLVQEQLDAYWQVAQAALSGEEIEQINDSRYGPRAVSSPASGVFSVPTPPSDSLSDKLDREIAAFERMQAQWAKQYSGQYVAVQEGAVCDSDIDEWKLIDRVFRQFPNQDILIQHSEKAGRSTTKV